MTREEQVAVATLRVQLREAQVEAMVLRERNERLVRLRENLKTHLERERRNAAPIGAVEQEVQELKRELAGEKQRVDKLKEQARGLVQANDAAVLKLRDNHSRDRAERQEQHAIELEKLGQRYEAMLSTNAMQAPRMSLALSNIVHFIDDPKRIPGIDNAVRKAGDELKFVLGVVRNCAAMALVPVPDMSQMGKPVPDKRCCERDTNNDGNCDRHPAGTRQVKSNG